MKKQILFLFSVLTLTTAFGQFNVYHPFPDSNAYWKEEYSGLINPGVGPSDGEFYNDYGYVLLGDTVVNGISYHKVYKVTGRAWCMNCTPIYYNVSSSIVGFVAAIRQDTVKKREYVCCTSSLKSHTLLYDFNLKVGDTLKQYSTIGIGEINYVSRVDSILIEGNYRKTWAIASKGQALDTIIEGIGSEVGLLEGVAIEFEQPENGLWCFRQNGYIAWSAHIPYAFPHNDSCTEYGPANLWTGTNSLSNTITAFSVYPNPASEQVTLSYQLPELGNNATLQLYNTMGQLVKTIAVKGYKGDLGDDVSALPNGIYYYTLVINGAITATSKLVVIH